MFARWQKLLLATTALVPLGFVPASANPLGAHVVGGSATVHSQGTANVTVNQSSDRAIINWNSFNIGAGETTQFVQPSASSVALNRVTGGLGPSRIYGSLKANGRIFVVNPDGILVGPSGKIDTAGFLATTNDIKNSDFMAGKYDFSIPGKPNASVVNEGNITAQTEGFAALVAPGVRNSGTITAKLGKIGLASANKFSLDFYGDKLITLGLSDSVAANVKDVATGKTLKSLVRNRGTLKADGGRVELTAVAARKIVDSVINNSGVVEANSVGTQNGMIVLGGATARRKPAGAPTQTVKVSGHISVAGKNGGETGGKVEITGESIQLAGANIDASGAAGGGTVLIGGDWSGGKPTTQIDNPSAALEPNSIPTATNVFFDPTSLVDVSSTDKGNGGKAVIWSDKTTSFNGTILAKGGTQFGDGGFVETSGHQQLGFTGWVDTGAPNGKAGTLLLDPQDVTIGTSGTWIVTPTALENALASADVEVTTGTGSGNGDITVAQPVTWSSANSLTLNADRNIQVNANITNSDGADVVLRADSQGTGIGTVAFGNSAQISTSGTVSFFYNPSDNPAGSSLNGGSYRTPTENFTPDVTGGATLDPYMLVNSIYDLQDIFNNASGSYALGKNIDASAAATWNSGTGFFPILGFSGHFDGLDHTVNGLTIVSSLPYVGLFGYTEPTSIIKNVGLTNVHITGTAASDHVGSLVGFNVGLISNAYATGSVTGGTTPAASGTNYSEVGGLVGLNQQRPGNGVISQSYADVTVKGGPLAIVGGLVGSNDSGKVELSYSDGAVDGGTPAGSLGSIVGGLVGYNTYGGSITQSYSTGTVSGGVTAGGLTGYDTYSSNYPSFSVESIVQVYSTGAVTGGTTNHGGLIGYAMYNFIGYTPYAYWDTQTSGQLTDGNGQTYEMGTTGLTTSDLKSGLPTGFDATVWGSDPSVNSGYPYLLWQTASSSPSPTILAATSGSPSLIPITVTANSLSKVYGASDPTLTYKITSGSLSGSDTFSGSLSRSSGENVGTYAVVQGTLSLPAAYTLTYVAGKLTITPASLTITADDKTKQAGAPNPPLTASYTGFVNGDGPGAVSGLSLSTTADQNSPAGSYPITPSGATAANYNISYIDGAMTITQAASTTIPPSSSESSAPSDVFGTGQTNTFSNLLVTISAGSTPPTIANINGVNWNKLGQTLASGNARGISYVLNDPNIKSQGSEVRAIVLAELHSLQSTLLKTGNIYAAEMSAGTAGEIVDLRNTLNSLVQAKTDLQRGDAKAAIELALNKIAEKIAEKIVGHSIGGAVPWDSATIAGEVIRDYEAGFIDSFSPHPPPPPY